MLQRLVARGEDLLLADEHFPRAEGCWTTYPTRRRRHRSLCALLRLYRVLALLIAVVNALSATSAQEAASSGASWLTTHAIRIVALFWISCRREMASLAAHERSKLKATLRWALTGGPAPPQVKSSRAETKGLLQDLNVFGQRSAQGRTRKQSRERRIERAVYEPLTSAFHWHDVAEASLLGAPPKSWREHGRKLSGSKVVAARS